MTTSEAIRTQVATPTTIAAVLRGDDRFIFVNPGLTHVEADKFFSKTVLPVGTNVDVVDIEGPTFVRLGNCENMDPHTADVAQIRATGSIAAFLSGIRQNVNVVAGISRRVPPSPYFA